MLRKIMEKKRIVLVSTYCDTNEKIEILQNNLKIIKSKGLDVMVYSPLSLPNEIINLCDFYIQTKENPLLYWPQKAVSSFIKIFSENCEIKLRRTLFDYGWAAIYQTKKLSEYASTFDYERYYHIVYDTLIDDRVISIFSSDKSCSFFPFHEHKVSLHLIALDKEELIKFSNYINLKSYLDFNSIVENWLYDTLTNSNLNFTIESEKVDDLMLYHKNEKLHDYSEIDGLTFFILKNIVSYEEVSLFFYNISGQINLTISVEGVEKPYIISDKQLIKLGFTPNNLKTVLISFNGLTMDITKKIEDIIHNLIEFNYYNDL